MFGSSRPRRFAALLLALAIALPGGVAAMSRDASAQPCESEEHGCPMALSFCCCQVGPADQSVPAPPQSRAGLSGPGLLPSFVPGLLTAPSGTESVSSAALRLYSPPHGYQSSDLSILLSVFLI